MADGSHPRLLRFALRLCLVLGVLGVGLGSASVSKWNEALPVPKERPADEDELTWQVQEAQLAAVARHRPALNALAVVNLVSSLALFAGSLLALLRAPQGLSALRVGLGLSEAYAAISLLVNLTIAREIIASVSVPEGTSPVGAIVTAASVVAGLILLAQLIFYVAMHIWLSRPSAIEALSPRT